MVQRLIYPDSSRLRQIERDLMPVITMDDPIFEIFPIEEDDSDLLRWEQKDNFRGLQQIRGLNGDPPRIARLGANQFIAEPGVYGEHGVIDEREITKRRTNDDRPIDITEPVLELQEQLLFRRVQRIKQIAWLLAMNGVFAISNAQGVLMHTDAYTMQTYTAPVPWSTFATARPLFDLRQVKLLARGHSLVFDRGSKLYANAVTINNVLMNLNPNDLFGRRGTAGATFNSLADINNIFIANDLPMLVPYDEGYINDAGTFTLFIPDGAALLVGRRQSNAPLGAYRMTRNAQNPGAAPGSYSFVVDNLGKDVPRKITVHDGHNGGPVLFYPSAMVRMAV